MFDEARKRLEAWWATGRMPILDAIKEVVVTAVIALLPVWAGVGLSLVFQEAKGFWGAVELNTERGDLFLLAAAAIAPLTLYLSVKTVGLPKNLTVRFPGGWLFIFLLLVIFGTCTILFAIKRVGDLPNSTLKIDHELFQLISFITYSLSILLALVVTAIKNFLVDLKVEDVFRADERDALDNWKRRSRK